MNESPRINDILQRLTVKVEARLDGAGIICKFSETAEQVFILTAKHNLCGAEFSDDPNWEDILISFLWNTQSSPPQYSSYKIQSSDQRIWSEDNEEDIAILVVNCSDIENLVGKLPVIRLTDNPESFRDIIFEGFPAAYDGKNPVRMYGNLIQLGKPKPYTIEVEVPTDLVANWLPNDSDKVVTVSGKDISESEISALDNCLGFSGSGLFLQANDSIFLLGVVVRFNKFNRFFCTNVKQIEILLKEWLFDNFSGTTF